MQSCKLIFELLNFAIDPTMKRVIAGDWNDKHTIAYCGTAGIDIADCDELIVRE